MAPLSRTFGASPDTEAEVKEGPEFTLQGPGWSETFRCLPVAPAGVLAAMVSGVSTDARGNISFNSLQIQAFVEGVLIEEDAEGKPADDVVRFQRLMYDKKRQVKIEHLAEAVKWLTEFYTGRPTTPPAR